MALNKKKVLKNAQKFTKKGAWDAAIEEYKKLLAENPKDRNLHNTVGDLYAKKNANDEAIVEYIQAAKSFEEDGFIPQTIALYRKILRIDSGRVDIYVKLAQLYSDQGLTRDAIAQHKIVADHYTKKGLVKKALDTYKQIADLDPTNLKVRIKLAELYNKESLQEQAVSEYLKIADILNKKGSIEESFHLLQKAIEIDPSNVDAQRGLARIYVSKGVFDKAVNALEVILEHDPDNLQNLFLIGKAYFKAANYEQAQTAFERVLSIDPTQIGVRENLGRVYLQKGEFDNALVQFDQVIDNFIAKKEYEMAKNLLNRLIQFKQDHVRIRERMIEISEKMGDESRALDEFKAIAEIYTNNEDFQKAVNIYDNLFQKNPADTEIRMRLETLRTKVKPETSATSTKEFADHFDKELDDLGVDDLMEGVEVESNVDLDIPVVSAELSNDDNEMIMDVDFEHLDEFQAPVAEQEKQNSAILNDEAADDYLNGIESEIDVDIEIDDMAMPEGAIIEEHVEDVAEFSGGVEDEEDSIEIDISAVESEIDESNEAFDLSISGLDEPQTAQDSTESPEELTDEKIIEDHFYHAEVYIKYGMTEKAVDHLQSILKIDVHNSKAYNKLFALHKEKGNRERAIAIALNAATIFDQIGDREQSEHFYQHIQSIQPEHPALLKKYGMDQKAMPLKNGSVAIEAKEIEEKSLGPNVPMEMDIESDDIAYGDGAGQRVDESEQEHFEDVSSMEAIDIETVETEDDYTVVDNDGDISYKKQYEPGPVGPIQSSNYKTASGQHDSSKDILKPAKSTGPMGDVHVPSKAKQKAVISEISDLDKVSSKKDKKIATASIDKLDSLAAAFLSPSRKSKDIKSKVTMSDIESAVIDGKRKRSTGLTPVAPLTLDDVRTAAGVKTPPRTIISSTKKSLEDLLIDSHIKKTMKTKGASPDIAIAIPSKKETHPPESGQRPLDNNEEIIARDKSAIETEGPIIDDYSAELEEAEFYIQQGLINEARLVYKKLLTHHPHAEDIKQKLELLERKYKKDEGEVKPVRTIDAEEADDSSITEIEEEFDEMDIDTELGSSEKDDGSEDSSPLFDEEEGEIVGDIEHAHEETTGMLDFGLGDEMAGIGSSAFDDEGNGDFFNLEGDSSDEDHELFPEEATDEKSTEHSLQDLFDEFKRGVDEQVSSEDYETHYNLGIAYKEMGLVDEAIQEFEKAARSKSMALQCCSMIGLCHMENGNYQQAADEFKSGIDTPGYEPEEYLGLQYDLGLTYELLGDTRKAFEAFSYVYSIDAKFREVSQKIKELRKNFDGDDSGPGGGNVTYV